jgi:hypothetical protein
MDIFLDVHLDTVNVGRVGNLVGKLVDALAE